MAGIPSRAEFYRLYWDEYKTLDEIGEMFGVSRQAIYGQMKRRGIPRRPINHHKVRKINGEIHKLCKGPLHDEPTWVPVSKFSKIKKSGKPRSMCTACDNARKGAGTRISVTPIRTALDEIIRRVGRSEAARLCGVDPDTIYMISYKKTRRINRETAKKILAALAELRQGDVVRHRDSIKHGSHLRGRTEKQPVVRRDFYKPTGDSDLEFRKKYRDAHVEHEREQDRARKARRKQGLTAA